MLVFFSFLMHSITVCIYSFIPNEFLERVEEIWGRFEAEKHKLTQVHVFFFQFSQLFFLNNEILFFFSSKNSKSAQNIQKYTTQCEILILRNIEEMK